MTVGHNPTDKSKLGRTKRHILTDKKGIPLSAVISSAITRDIKLVTDVVDNVVIKRHHHHIKPKQEEWEENFNIYVLIKHTIPNKKNKN